MYLNVGDASGKEPACQCRNLEMRVPSLGGDDSLEKGMAIHSSSLACRIPWTETCPRQVIVHCITKITTEATYTHTHTHTHTHIYIYILW